MNLIEDLKGEFKKKENALAKLILINVIVFGVLSIIQVICYFTSQMPIFDAVYRQFTLPSSLQELLFRPWSIFTYFFAHARLDIFHILSNMLGLYWFGYLIADFVGSRRLVSIYILGGLTAAFFYILTANVFSQIIPISMGSALVGASGAVFAVSTAAATLVPNYQFNLFFIGTVRIMYINAFYIFISFIGLIGHNAGGNVAHLGGALLGFIFVKQLKAGRDLGKPIHALYDFISGIFKKKSNLKVAYKKKNNSSDPVDMPSQQEIDDILDKISVSGYESLTKEEKQKLFKASQKN